MKSYVEVLKTPAKKERSKKDGLISQDKNRNNIAPKRPNRYLQIFLGHFFIVIILVIKPYIAKLKEGFMNTRRTHQVIRRREIRIYLHYSKIMI